MKSNLPGFIFSFILAISTYTLSYSQDAGKNQAKKNFLERVYVGGNLGLQFGTITLVDVSPLAGYKITDKLSAGLGVTYQYYRYHDRYTDFNTNVYGGRVFGRYYFMENFFAHSEYEVLSLEAYNQISGRINVSSLFVGGGYSQAIGANAALTIVALWNLNESVYSPYSNPVIRAGINIGL